MKRCKIWLAIAGGGLVLFVSPISTQAADLETPAWIQAPTLDDLLAAVPARGLQQVSGQVVLDCHVDTAGKLGDCRVTSETPSDLGFGAAALGLAHHYRLADGAPARRVQFPVKFGPPDVDTSPDWRRKPRQEDLLVVWPTEAWKKGQGGSAVIRCVVSVDGVLRGCRVVNETPAGAGFGMAAIALTPQMLMRPAMKDGKPVPGLVNLPLTFAMPDGGPLTDIVGSRMSLNASIAWVKAPTFADVDAAYPSKGRMQRVSGHVNMSCNFTASGKLTGCTVINQTPTNFGFGAAAKSLIEKFQAPATIADQPIHKFRVQLPVTFSAAMLEASDPLMGRPKWAGLPTREQLAQAFANGVGPTNVSTVRVGLACVVADGGFLNGCSVEREDPAGHGYGQRALSLTPYFKMTTWTIEGLPTIGGRIRIPIRYELTPPDAAPSAPEKSTP